MMRGATILTVLLGLLVIMPSVVHADTPRGMDLLYSCTEKGLVLKKHTIKSAAQQKANKVKPQDGLAAKPEKKKSKPKGEEIKTSSLINLVDPAAPETSLRKDSKVLDKTCGELSVKITAGYLNKNQQGMLGGIVYPVVSVSHKGKLLVDGLRIGNGQTCEQPDVVDKAACQKQWAKKASFLRDHQKFSVLLARDYVERQDITVKE